MSDRARPVQPLALFECYWACRSASGTRLVWAHDENEAVQHLEAHASMYGIPHEHPLVGHPTRVEVREADQLEVFDDRAA